MVPESRTVSSFVTRKAWVIRLLLTALFWLTAWPAPARAGPLHRSGCPTDRVVQTFFGYVETEFITVTPSWHDDGGGHLCHGFWTESREQEVEKKTGWYWVTIACVVAAGTLEVVTDLLTRGQAAALKGTLAAGCYIASQNPQTELVTVTQTRACERYTDWDGICKVGCSNWQ